MNVVGKYLIYDGVFDDEMVIFLLFILECVGIDLNDFVHTNCNVNEENIFTYFSNP